MAFFAKRYRVALAMVGAIMCVSPGGVQTASAAPDNTHGMALLSAEVSDTGTLLFGSGATSSMSLGAPSYGVTFDRDVSLCVFSVTPFSANSIPAASLFDSHTVLVYFTDRASGNFVATTFYLLGFCQK